MPVANLRKELWARNINNKGLKSQLIARLVKVLKQESAKGDPADAEMEIEECEVEPEPVDASPGAVITIEDPTPDDASKEDDETVKVVEKEKSLWKTRHALPENPHLIVHPSRTAKSGKFDCTVMTLSLLLDYRPEDSKEHSFEVSLFAELFNEMLMRDFGFNIYKALYMLPDKPKEEKEDRKKDSDSKKSSDGKEKRSDEDKDKDKEKSSNSEKEKKSDSSEKDRKDSETKKSSDSKKEDRAKRDEKRDDPILIGDEENSSDKKSTSGDRKDKEKKDRQKLVTKDPHLLLSFVYFDTSHCGYIFEKDVEELLYTLGLNLSRAQVRRLVAKVVTRDSFLYRQLTDKPKDEEADKVTAVDGNAAQDGDSKTAMKEMDLSELAAGNKRLLPVFKGDDPQSDTSEPPNKRSKSEPKEAEGFVTYKGGLLDLEKLLNQLQRSEQARLDTEARLVELKAENTSLQEKQSKSASTLSTLTADLQDSKKKLNETQSQLSKITVNSKLFHTTLKEIETKIGHVTQFASTVDDDISKSIKQESGSRWSSDDTMKKENDRKDNSHDSKKHTKRESDD